MLKLRYTGVRSYEGYGVKATVNDPFVYVESKIIAESLMKTKRFVLVELAVERVESDTNDLDDSGNSDIPNAPNNPNIDLPTGSPSENWTNKQLRAYAEENGIDLSGLNSRATRADILARIQETEGAIEVEGTVEGASAIDYSAEV